MSSSNALFGNPAARNQSKNLVEFKAGKMTMKGKIVYPDKRKGLVYVYQSDDSLMHFCWKDRTTGVVDDDLIIFPDDCEFKRIDACTTGRAYVLKFKSSSRRFFFWLQESKVDKDEENCKKVNDVLNNPPTAGSSRSGGTTPDGDLQSLLGSMSQQQLMQLFGTLGSSGSSVGQLSGLTSLLGTMGNRSHSRTSTVPSTTNNTTSSTPSTNDSSQRPILNYGARPAPSMNPIQLNDLQSFLSNMQPSTPTTATEQPNVDLSSAFNAESVSEILNDPTLITELTPFLPPSNESSFEEQVRGTLTSPQFQQAVSMFSAALQSGQLGPVIQQFQLPDEAVKAANKGSLDEFVRALETSTLNEDTEEASEPPKKKTDLDKNKDVGKKDDSAKKDEDDMALG